MDSRIMPPFKLAECGSVENTDGQICDREGRIIIKPMIHTYYPPAYPENKILVREFSEFIVSALNEKCERERIRAELMKEDVDVRCDDCRHYDDENSWCRERDISVDSWVEEPCACYEPTEDAINEKTEAAGEGEEIRRVFLDKTIAEKLLHEVEVHINNATDDPRMGGRAPEYLYELQCALLTAISAEGK